MLEDLLCNFLRGGFSHMNSMLDIEKIVIEKVYCKRIFSFIFLLIIIIIN